eukprot:TRINITY_DN8701_c0_g2_i2.p1 TRINITY_DN8701_c0_g2~~TRINITY_DN8701_c0_g2_i2.p1  ORF type:complete len:225 (+),score=60.63 TRINITY_DN8701_c0_g2_i2:518-1192(+)
MPAHGNIVTVLSSMLTDFTKQNDKQRPNQMPNTGGPAMFEAYQAPGISIEKYFLRLDKYFCASDECYVYSLILVDRLINKHPTLYLTSYNVHRLLVTAIVISAKIRDDCYYNNRFYANVAGIRLSELNYLEMHFLLLLDFHLHVSLDEFCRYIYEIKVRYGPITGYSGKYVAMAEKILEEEQAASDEDEEEEEEEEDAMDSYEGHSGDGQAPSSTPNEDVDMAE